MNSVSRAPSISILMPTYNQAHYIDASIESVLNQTSGDWELVICDDGSTDGTRDVIERHMMRDPRIRYIRKSNGGTGSALNRALWESRAPWISWLSSDDLYEPRAIATFLDAIAEHQDTRFFHAHHFTLEDQIGRKSAYDFQDGSLNTPRELQVLRLLQSNHINGITICIHRDVFTELGGFNERNRYGQDYEMWLSIAARYPWTFIPIRTSSTRLHDLVGQVCFPEGGIYCSAVAAIEFLNKKSFAEYFPLLDLKNAEHAWQAVISSIQLSLKEDAFIYQGVGLNSAFLDRVCEWLFDPANHPASSLVVQALQPLKDSVFQLDLPDCLRRAFSAIFDPWRERFVYRAHDPYELLYQNMLTMEAFGATGKAEAIRTFFNKVGGLRQTGDTTIAPHVSPMSSAQNP